MPPDIRVTVAQQVINKAIDPARSVWPSVVGTTSDGLPYYRAPEAADYKDYASKQSYDKAVRWYESDGRTPASSTSTPWPAWDSPL